MAYLTGGGRTRSLHAQLQSLRGKRSGVRQRVEAHKASLRGYGAHIKNLNTQIGLKETEGKGLETSLEETESKYWSGESGQNIMKLNKAYLGIKETDYNDPENEKSGLKIQGLHDLTSGFNDATKDAIGARMNKKLEVNWWQTEYDRVNKPGYTNIRKEKRTRNVWENVNKRGGNWLTGFFSYLEQQLKGTQEYEVDVDDAPAERFEAKRGLKTETDTYNKMLNTKVEQFGKTQKQIESDLALYKVSFTSEDTKKLTDLRTTTGKKLDILGGEILSLHGNIKGIKDTQDVTLGQLKAQQGIARGLESSMASMQSLFAGAKLQEQMDMAKGGKNGKKQQARIGQGYA